MWHLSSVRGLVEMPRQDPLPSSVLAKPACGTGTWPSIPNERSWALPLMCDTGGRTRESFEKRLCGQRVSRQGALWAFRAPPAPTANQKSTELAGGKRSNSHFNHTDLLSLVSAGIACERRVWAVMGWRFRAGVAQVKF